jgi:hypothetical protein
MVEYHEMPMKILPSGILSNMGPLKYGGVVLMLPTMTCKISEAQNKLVYCSVLHTDRRDFMLLSRYHTKRVVKYIHILNAVISL